MIPHTPFQQMLLPRLAKARDRLAGLIWQMNGAPLPVSRTAPTREHRALGAVRPDEFASVTETPGFWGRMFDQCWWKVQVPAGPAGRYLRWLDQAEATVYVDGVPYYGIDPGHHYAPLPDGVSEIVIESLCARTAIWVEGEAQGIDVARGSRFDGAHLATRNDAAWHAWHDIDVLLQVLVLLDRPEYPPGYDLLGRTEYRPELTKAEPLLRRWIHRINEAVDALDSEGVEACGELLRGIYRDFPAAGDALDIVLTGHAHVDLVWLWPERAGEFKATHSFANALRMMERYPEITFGYSQPASYEAVRRRSPALMQRVESAIGRGQWEATGAMYVESDVQLTCGEALVRAFALGQAGFRELRGEDSRCVWLPDVFGYSAALPTIMAGFGVPYFYTTKLHWSSATRFPYSSFRWVGMDGSEVVAHVSWYHYCQTIVPTQLRNCEIQHRQSAVHGEALFPCGYGDGGGGLNESMCERARRLSNLAAMPRAKWGLIEGFFDRLADRAEQLPRWRGEMYLEYHRGVQTTHGRLKAAFRAAERGLQVWEAVRCATGGGPVDEQMWKRVCFAQFHDYIPGSSIAEVYDEAVPELEGIAADALRHAGDELAATARGEAKACVFNPLPVERLALIDGRLVKLPPLAGVAIDALETIEAPEPTAGELTLRNGRVEARFTESGEIASLVVDGHAIAFEQPGAQVWTFPDVPAIYDAWDVDRYTLSNGVHHRHAATVSQALSPGCASLSFQRQLGAVGTVTVRFTLERGAAVLRIGVDLDLRQPQVLVKLAFPTAYRGREARYGGPFGSVKRPQWQGPLANEAMFENPASRWACVADDDERDGLMLVSEAKYGFGALEGLLHVSLARSAKVTQPNVSGSTTTLVGANRPGTFADMGEQHVELAVGRFRADAPLSEQPAALADALYTPTLRYAGVPVSAGLVGVDGPVSLVPCWAVPGDRGSWTLRCHETLGGRGRVAVHLARGRAVAAVDLRGLPMAEQAEQPTAKAYGVSSYRVVSS